MDVARQKLLIGMDLSNDTSVCRRGYREQKGRIDAARIERNQRDPTHQPDAHIEAPFVGVYSMEGWRPDRTPPENRRCVVDTKEQERLKDLRSYKILDTDPEQAFDDLTLIASKICEAPVALITLVDEDRQWFKSRIGTDIRETPRSISFCAHAIQQKGLFTIPDALNDPRFRDNPVVKGEPHVRFYAGAPIESRDGHALGTLCVIDYVPRKLTDDQNQALEALERQVAAQMERCGAIWKSCALHWGALRR